MSTSPHATIRAPQPGLSELAAAAFVLRHGGGALLILEERAETAEELGHKLAARTWREMAGAAAKILGVGRLDIALPGAAGTVFERAAVKC